MIKFVNFEFIFAIKGPKLAGRGVNNRNNTAQNRGAFFYFHPWLDLCNWLIALLYIDSIEKSHAMAKEVAPLITSMVILLVEVERWTFDDFLKVLEVVEQSMGGKDLTRHPVTILESRAITAHLNGLL